MQLLDTLCEQLEAFGETYRLAGPYFHRKSELIMFWFFFSVIFQDHIGTHKSLCVAKTK